MALTLIATYSKRLGLPGYSSHQFSVCVETEITSIDEVGDESNRLYHTLQQSVDHEIQTTGFVPQDGYGITNGNDRPNGASSPARWRCTEKQQDLILKLIEDNHMIRADIEVIAVERYGKPIGNLDRKEASTFIDELFGMVNAKPISRQRNVTPPAYQKGNRR